jgi:hypothetical protein
MGLFDFLKDKNKKTYTLGALGMPPYLEIDLEKRILRVTVGPMQLQDFPLDQVTQIQGGQKSLSQGSLTIYVNGVVAKEMICDTYNWAKLPDIEKEILSAKK